MLSDTSRPVIEATLPLIGSPEIAEAWTEVYWLMAAPSSNLRKASTLHRPTENVEPLEGGRQDSGRNRCHDVLEISNPYGEITLKEGNGPVVLASAGIGCTPTASILRSLAEAGSDRQVLVLHAESNLDSWALRRQMTDDVERLACAELHLWLEEPQSGATRDSCPCGTWICQAVPPCTFADRFPS